MIHISMKMMILYKIIRSMPCFFKEVTHFYCPACGGTRSVIALLHLDIERAFLCNPTVVYTGVMFLWCICRMDGKETDSQRDEEHEAEIVDVDFGSVYFLWICGDQKYTGVPVWI